MEVRLSQIMLVRALIFILAAAHLAAANRTPVPAVESKPHACRVRNLPDEILCATYPVWENRERRSGRRIGLNIVILPATGPDKALDPVFMLHGGPGAAATQLALGVSRSSKAVSGTFPVDAVRACRERLSKIADLAMYTTASGIDDVD